MIDDDLDPAALQKAVRFASISSIALVSNCVSCLLHSRFIECSSLSVYCASCCHSAALILCEHGLQRAWFRNLGLVRHRMGDLRSPYGHTLSFG